MSAQQFCTGNGRVMMPGFQFAANGGPCILFLFSGWNVNTAVKYAMVMVACFVMGLSNEGLSLLRRRCSIWFNGKSELLKSVPALIYAVQMMIAYSMMLLIMTYEIGVFMCLILGLAFGNFLFSLKFLQPKPSKDEKSKAILPGGTTPCCTGNEADGLINNHLE
eukprot:gene4861-8455_t